MCDKEMMHLIILLLFILGKAEENIQYPIGNAQPPTPPTPKKPQINVIQ